MQLANLIVQVETTISLPCVRDQMWLVHQFFIYFFLFMERVEGLHLINRFIIVNREMEFKIWDSHPKEIDYSFS